MHKILAYSAFGWLTFTGVMHFIVDVVSQHLRGKRLPGPETSLYYGLHTAYAVGQLLFGLFGILIIRQALPVLAGWPARALCIAAFCAWLSVCLAFIEYWEPKMNIAIFGTLLALAILKYKEGSP